MAIKLYNWLPNLHYRRNYIPARLTHAFHAFAGAKPPEFEEWLPPWMNPSLTKPKPEPVYSAELAADVDLAFRLGLLSQTALVALGPKRLREAGAFKPKPRKEDDHGNHQ